MLGFLRPLPEAPPLPKARRAAAYRAGRATMLLGVTALYACYYLTRSVLDVAKGPMIAAGAFDADQLGTIGAMMTAAYGVGKLVNGFIADRVNVARFLPLGLFVSALLNLAMGSNDGFLAACALWLLNGYVQGVGAAASVRGLTQWFPAREHGPRVRLLERRALGGRAADARRHGGAHCARRLARGVHRPGIACAGVALVAALVLKDRPQAYGLPPAHAEATTSTSRRARRSSRCCAIRPCGSARSRARSCS
jgi:OPA family sugar phosphate sensor protein UhpC-like MFS transporter